MFFGEFVTQDDEGTTMEDLFNKRIIIEPSDPKAKRVKSYNPNCKRTWYYSKNRNIFCAFPDKYSKNPEQEFEFLCYGTHEEAKREFGNIISHRIPHKKMSGGFYKY